MTKLNSRLTRVAMPCPAERVSSISEGYSHPKGPPAADTVKCEKLHSGHAACCHTARQAALPGMLRAGLVGPTYNVYKLANCKLAIETLWKLDMWLCCNV